MKQLAKIPTRLQFLYQETLRSRLEEVKSETQAREKFLPSSLVPTSSNTSHWPNLCLFCAPWPNERR